MIDYVVLLWDILRIDRGQRFSAAFRWVLFSFISVLAVLGALHDQYDLFSSVISSLFPQVLLWVAWPCVHCPESTH